MALTKGKKDPAAVALGRKGGKKGGPARAAKLTAEQRSESARKAVKARWTRAKKADQSAPATANTSDDAVLDILSRMKATKDLAEIRNLSARLERVIFHKQHAHS